MARGFAKFFYQSPAWRKCREAYIEKRKAIDGGMCEVCHDDFGYIVHHKVALTSANISDPDIALSYKNLSYECKRCHDKHEGHGVREKEFAIVLFDGNGNPIPPTKKP